MYIAIPAEVMMCGQVGKDAQYQHLPLKGLPLTLVLRKVFTVLGTSPFAHLMQTMNNTQAGSSLTTSGTLTEVYQ